MKKWTTWKTMWKRASLFSFLQTRRLPDRKKKKKTIGSLKDSRIWTCYLSHHSRRFEQYSDILVLGFIYFFLMPPAQFQLNQVIKSIVKAYLLSKQRKRACSSNSPKSTKGGDRWLQALPGFGWYFLCDSVKWIIYHPQLWTRCSLVIQRLFICPLKLILCVCTWHIGMHFFKIILA